MEWTDIMGWLVQGSREDGQSRPNLQPNWPSGGEDVWGAEHASHVCPARVLFHSHVHTHKETPKIPISSQISEGPSITTRRVSGEAGLWAESSTHGDYAPGLTRHFVLSMIYGVQLC